ncbi:hypothetical protein DFH08DRAFT_1038454 [Mycena albidolilacea]|uniref:Uncharacterized protein n=1 Tax=Mycena albidolilacea TaxID=1033008 RepID=A0AAD7EZ93_9AGAR|nr:hypothetical protein DFH08DRAFT_1038454 [Mycena albidolilacea]
MCQSRKLEFNGISALSFGVRTGSVRSRKWEYRQPTNWKKCKGAKPTTVENPCAAVESLGSSFSVAQAEALLVIRTLFSKDSRPGRRQNIPVELSIYNLTEEEVGKTNVGQSLNHYKLNRRLVIRPTFTPPSRNDIRGHRQSADAPAQREGRLQNPHPLSAGTRYLGAFGSGGRRGQRKWDMGERRAKATVRRMVAEKCQYHPLRRHSRRPLTATNYQSSAAAKRGSSARCNTRPSPRRVRLRPGLRSESGSVGKSA